MVGKIKVTCSETLVDELNDLNIVEKKLVTEQDHMFDPSFFSGSTMTTICTIIILLQAPSAIEYFLDKITTFMETARQKKGQNETIRIQTPKRVFVLSQDSTPEEWNALKEYLNAH